jgi:hypothetical protein
MSGFSAFDEKGRRKRFAGSSLGNACAEDSCHQSKCYQLVKSAADEPEILPAAERGDNDQAPPAQIGFSCSGQLGRRQFQRSRTCSGWTSFSEFENRARRRGVPGPSTPPSVHRFPSPRWMMHPPARSRCRKSQRSKSPQSLSVLSVDGCGLVIGL